MQELLIIGVNKSETLPSTYDPANNVVLFPYGVCIHEGGTNLPQVPAIYFHLKDPSGLPFMFGLTSTMLASVMESLERCQKAWIAGEKPRNPYEPPGKNSADPSLN